MKLRHFFFALCALFAFHTAHASIMSYVSDLISTSAPSASATHTIQFTVPDSVPPSGSIAIVPEPGSFNIPADFDYTDVDFAVWDGTSYVDRDLAPSPDATHDGVAVVTGTSGSITFTLSSSAGLSAGDKVQVRLGTNATYGVQGSDSIPNPNPVGSYRVFINSYDQNGVSIDYGTAMIAVVMPVSLRLPLQNVPPAISNGLPSGTLEAGNPSIEITFNTDRSATCRYSTVPNVPYASMTQEFSSTQNKTFFYLVVGNHQDGTTYDYYVRCIGLQGAVDTDDYDINFTLKPTPISNTSVSQSGGVVGQGDFVNGSMTLYQSTVTLSGFTAPGSTIAVLKDGVQALSTQAGSSGAFQAVLPNLDRGTYTFSLYATDSHQLKTSNYSATLAVGQATENAISNILLPPTIALASDAVAASDPVSVTGAAAPGSSIDISVLTPSGNPQLFSASSTGLGDWSLTIPPNTFSNGSYFIRARANLGTAQSDYGARLSLGIGQAAPKNAGNKADINGDGKVNLIDFSIMLTAWGTATDRADLNGDGTVNLADFSILLFNWTG